MIYENLLYCNANDCLMISTHCQKISGSLQEEMMLHGKYSDLIATLFFHFVFFSERQNYLMDCNVKFFLVYSRNIVHCHAQGFSKPVFAWTCKTFIDTNYETPSNIYQGVFCQNRWQLKLVRYSSKKSSIIGAWQGLKYASNLREKSGIQVV